MNKPEEYCVVLTTCGDKQEAKNLACSLVESHLAACVQMTEVTSFYEWENKVNKDDEVLLLIKAKAELFEEIKTFISENHSYEIPEIIELPIRGGLENYFKWIDEVSR
jgi:periplasmic divalent cation tolerance protein